MELVLQCTDRHSPDYAQLTRAGQPIGQGVVHATANSLQFSRTFRFEEEEFWWVGGVDYL